MHRHAGFFRVSVIHRTLTLTTGSLCVRIHTELGQLVSTTFLTRNWNSQFFLVLLTGLERRVFGTCVRRSTNYVHPPLRYCAPLFSFLNSISIPWGKFVPPYLGKATAAARAALPSHTIACWVLSCFRNPPKSYMDYMIFNVRKWSFSCVRITIQTAVGHTNSESAQQFLTRKHSRFSCASDGFRTQVMGSIGSWVRRSTNWAPPSPEISFYEYNGTLVVMPLHPAFCNACCIWIWRGWSACGVVYTKFIHVDVVLATDVPDRKC